MHSIIGYYWDWVWPIFGNHFSHFLSSNLGAWSGTAFPDGPATYATGLYYYFSVYVLSWALPIPPEYIWWVVWGMVFVAMSLLLYRLFKNNIMFVAAFIVSPVMYYKLMAGHTGTFLSLIFFVALLTYTLNRFQNRWRDYIIVGLLFAFVGFQIQYFVFAGIYLFLFFVMVSRKIDWRKAGVSLGIILGINLPWLMNFVTNRSSAITVSGQAASEVFQASSSSSLWRILVQAYSPATNISTVYPKWTFIYFGILTLSIIALVGVWLWRKYCKHVQYNVEQSSRLGLILTSLTIFILLGTGFYWQYPILGLKFFYPMFRESGHLAPVILLLELLSIYYLLPLIIVRLKTLSTARWIANLYLAGFVLMSIPIFLFRLPWVDYAMLRDKLQPYSQLSSQDTATYRVVTYPFWNQYGIQGVANKTDNDKLLNNSGWDSFILFSGLDYVSNYQAGGKSIADTMQNALMQDYNLQPLKDINVKYIIDLSSVYESNWDQYTSADTYQNNTTLVKNNQQFIANLVNKNNLTVLGNGIYRLETYAPRISIEDRGSGVESQLTFTRHSNSKYSVNIDTARSGTRLKLLDTYNQGWKIYPAKSGQPTCQVVAQVDGGQECRTQLQIFNLTDIKYLFKKPFFSTNHRDVNGMNVWQLDAEADGEQIVSGNYEIFYLPQAYFTLAVILSGVTFIISIGLIVIAKRRFRRSH